MLCWALLAPDMSPDGIDAWPLAGSGAVLIRPGRRSVRSVVIDENPPLLCVASSGPAVAMLLLRQSSRFWSRSGVVSAAAREGAVGLGVVGYRWPKFWFRRGAPVAAGASITGVAAGFVAPVDTGALFPSHPWRGSLVRVYHKLIGDALVWVGFWCSTSRVGSP